tara:strand:+ start:626 stop:904 length:279 start_codon:yes stop_codon:yes gene_type:complete
MKNLIHIILKEESDKQTDLANSNTSERNICDDFSTESYEDLVNLINKSHVSKEDKPKIEELLTQLKKDNKRLGNDLDNLNTYQHKIATQLCR